MEKIGIFCSACEQINPHYFEVAHALGAWLGNEGKTLIYGGASLGLMECIAQAAKAHGAQLVGVVPTLLEERNCVSDLPDIIFHTVDLSDRKDVLVRESDVLVALPGGVGTLDEVFHVIAASTIGYHSKKVILYNVEGFWDDLLHLLDCMAKQGFIRKPLSESYAVVQTLDELKALLQ